MEHMRTIIEAELRDTDALNCIWDKIPDEALHDLVSLVLQKMSWAKERGREEYDSNRL